MTRVPHIQLGRSGPRCFATLCEFTALDLIAWGDNEGEALANLRAKVKAAFQESHTAQHLISETLEALDAQHS